jgi:hypothetical protein
MRIDSGAGEKEKATPARRGDYFLWLELSVLTGRLLSPVGQVKQMPHLSAFVSVLLLFGRTIRHLFERVFGTANHFKH